MQSISSSKITSTGNETSIPFHHYCNFNLFIYSRTQENQIFFLLHKSSDKPTFTHFPGNFTKNDPAIYFAIAREFVTQTKGLLFSPNLQYFLGENLTPCEIKEIVVEDLASIRPQKLFSFPINDICKLLCEDSYVYQEQNGDVNYFIEIPFLNVETVNYVALQKGINIEMKYFSLEEILDEENKLVSEDLKNCLRKRDIQMYIKKFILELEPVETQDHYAVISCDPNAKSYMLNSLHYSVFRKHGEHWRFYKAYENDLPTDEELKKLKGIIIPGSGQSAFDTVSWYKELFECIRKVVNEYKHINLLGICFGAQIIAQALGGKVAKMDREFVRGGDVLKVLPSFYELGFIKDLKLNIGKPFVIGKAHGDHIVELPPGALHHASSGTTEIEVYTIGDNVFCLQGHPEFNEAWTAGANYRMRKLTEEDYEKYAEEFIKQSFPYPVSQEELLIICYSFLKKSNQNKVNEGKSN